MSDGDEDTASDESEAAETEVDEETLNERLDSAEESLEEAETEADLDAVEAELDAVEASLETADLPEPEDEDETGPREELESRIEDLRGDVEDARGPYAEDVIDEIEAAKESIEGGDWTETGRSELESVVSTFVEEVESVLDTDLGATVTEDADDQTAALEAAAKAVGAEELDPDEDRDTIASLLEAAETLTAGVDESEEWTDLTIRERLDAHGFYDVLDHLKDYPPEWHALKIYEKRAETDMILLALDLFESNFMEAHCLEALNKLGDEAALDPMLQRAEKRDMDAIEVLGKIGSDEALDTILEYVDTESDPRLQKVTMKALGEIGSEEATQEVANQLVAENPNVRSYAARSLGLIGDTRAIDPLADVLEDDDSDTVRASAAWALNQIGTEEALERVRDYADDRAFLVQSEAEKAV